MSGKTTLRPPMRGVREAASLERKITLNDFSPRERETMRLVALGFSTKEIMIEMGLSRNTISDYRQSIMKKLGVHDVVRLTHCAIRLGVIEVWPCRE